MFSCARGSRWIQWWLSSVFLLLVVAGKAKAASRWETLEAIHAIENPSNSPKPGRFGELGAYQFRQTTWTMYSRRPFSDATNRHHSDEVAVLHYEWIKTTLGRAGIEASTYNIALAWNAGASAVIGDRVSHASRDYASRVENIANSLHAAAAAQVALR
jgi:hypothetical protein